MSSEPEFVQSDTALTELSPPQFGKLVTQLTVTLWDNIPEETREALVRNQGGRFSPEQNPVEEFSKIVPIVLSGFLGAAFGIVQQNVDAAPQGLNITPEAALQDSPPVAVVGKEFAASFIAHKDRYLTFGNVIAQALLVGAPPTVLPNTHPVYTLLTQQAQKQAQLLVTE